MNPTSRIRAWLLVFCLTFVPLHLLISLSGMAYANTAAHIPETLAKNSPAVPPEPNSPVKYQLAREEIRAVEHKEDLQKENTLRQMIEQVRSIEFGPQKRQPAAPAVVPVAAPAIEPNDSSLDVQATPENRKQDAESRRSEEKVTPETLQKLKSLTEQPGKVGDPLEMGEILFSGGSLKEAVTFYQEALKRIDPNDPNAPNERPWILFQIGSCLRDHDRPAAAKIYGQLLSEYPQSPWTELGEAQAKLIEWYLRDEPHKLIEEHGQLGRK